MDIMIALAVTEKEILIGTVDKKSFSKPSIRIIGAVEYLNKNLGSKLEEVIEEKNEVAFTVSDFQTYLYRFEVPVYITQEALTSTILDKAREVIPTPLDELLYDFSVLGTTAESHIILFAATPKDTLQTYFQTLEKKQSIASFIIPDTIAIFEVLKQEIHDNDLILYLEEGTETSKIAFYDRFGPFLTIAEPIAKTHIEKEMENAIKVVKERYGKDVTKVVLAGEKSIHQDAFSFKKIIDVEIIKIDTIVTHISQGIEFPSHHEHSSFLPLIGLALSSANAPLINLARKEGDARTLYVPSHLTTSDEYEGKKTFEPTSEKDNSDLSFDKPKSSKKIIMIVGVVIILAALIAFLIKIRPKGSSQTQKTAQITSTISPTQAQKTTPTATPTPTVAKNKIAIKVLNGSGTKGEASDVADTLKDAGFTKVTTGNADDFDHKGLEIDTNSTGETYLNQIKQTLSDSYSNIKTDKLSSDSDEDIQIIIGK